MGGNAKSLARGRTWGHPCPRQRGALRGDAKCTATGRSGLRCLRDERGSLQRERSAPELPPRTQGRIALQQEARTMRWRNRDWLVARLCESVKPKCVGMKEVQAGSEGHGPKVT